MSDPGQKTEPPIGAEPMFEWKTVSAVGASHVECMRVPGGYIYSMPQSQSAVYVPFADLEVDPYVLFPTEGDA